MDSTYLGNRFDRCGGRCPVLDEFDPAHFILQVQGRTWMNGRVIKFNEIDEWMEE